MIIKASRATQLATLLSFAVLGTCLARDAGASTPSVLGAPKAAKATKAKDAKKKEPPAKPGELRKKIRLSPRGLRFGMSNEQIAKLYDKVFEKEFVPLYKRVSPGPRMAALDAELENKKGRLRRSVIEFGKTATGIDETPLAGEYTYQNKESMSRITLRSGTTRHFFFFSNRLWKIYDERPLRKGSQLGKDFKTAVARLTKTMGVGPIMLEPNPDEGRRFDEAVWMNDEIIIRLVNREFQNVVGLVYVSKDVQTNIASYRKHKKEDPSKLSKDIKMVTRKSGVSEDPSEKAPKQKAK
ncbi:MAG: hypothetical protein KC766_30730 [Myxococcales bacterium]|nr:hypothetical protein [Myxococcales bacterium]